MHEQLAVSPDVEEAKRERQDSSFEINKQHAHDDEESETTVYFSEP
jgi:hypothetical protein